MGNRTDLAFDRLGWLRVIVDDVGARYELVGTARRRPRTCAVSTATAVALMRAGVPMVLSRQADREP